MNSDHPTKDIKFNKSRKLEDKKIILGITGSIAAVQAVKFTRELIRHGAEVKAVMSDWARDIITPESVEFATGNEVITEITGKVEHVQLAGKRSKNADLYLIYPSTANTISKIANGIDDTPVTTFATTAFPNMPIMIAPAMHQSMYDHEIVKENIDKLKGHGVKFVEPIVEEGKAKAITKEELTHRVIKKLYKKDLKDKNILITSGPTREYLDPVRFITSDSSGKTGVSIAEESELRGADVELIRGKGSESTKTREINGKEVETTEEMLKEVEKIIKNKDIDICVLSAAVADFKPENNNNNNNKIKSGKEITLKLKPTPKILKKIKKLDSDIKVIGYKAEHDINEKELTKKAKNKLEEADLIVANDVSEYGFGTDKNEVYFVTKEETKHLPLKSKENIAEDLWNYSVDKIL